MIRWTVSLRTCEEVKPWTSCRSIRSNSAVQLAPSLGWLMMASTKGFAPWTTADWPGSDRTSFVLPRPRGVVRAEKVVEVFLTPLPLDQPTHTLAGGFRHVDGDRHFLP